MTRAATSAGAGPPPAERPGSPPARVSHPVVATAVRSPGHTRRMELIPREYVALPGGGLKRVYSLAGADGSVILGDHGAWLASRAKRCACGSVCLGSGQTCGSSDCIANLASA
jgi:hypothetical protein